MALADNRGHRIATFCALYVAQGVPWGFMLITLPTFLAFNYDVSDTEIGRLKAVILLPWSFKLIWAPLMDSVTIRSMGRRRSWIIGAEWMMAITLLGLLIKGELSQDFQLLYWMYFLHNCFASLQDVCTDALAVDILPVSEQGQMNGLMWGSKLLGKGVAATLLAYVLRDYGLEACVMVQFVLLISVMMVPLLILEREGEKRFPWSRGQAMTTGDDGNLRRPGQVLHDLLLAYSLPTALVFTAFTLVKIVGAGINEVVTNTLYTQQLGWTDVEYSMVSGLYVLAPQILATVLAGFLADRFVRRSIIACGFSGFGLLAATFAAYSNLWKLRWFTTTYILLSEGFLAMASVGFLSLSMKLSWTKSAGTVFTTYMTLSNISHVIGNSLAGPVRNLFMFPSRGNAANLFSYNLTFWLVSVSTLLPLLLLLWVRPSHIRHARNTSSETT